MVLSCPDKCFKRAGERDQEQVSTNISASTRRLSGEKQRCFRSDKEAVATKRNPVIQSGVNPERPHPSPKIVRQEDCEKDHCGKPAWGKPAQSTSSQQGRNQGQSSSCSYWRLRVRENAATSAHNINGD